MGGMLHDWLHKDQPPSDFYELSCRRKRPWLRWYRRRIVGPSHA